MIAACVLPGVWSLLTGSPFGADWLAVKVILFGGIVACGLGVRHHIRKYLQVWPEVLADRSTPEIEQALRSSMIRGTWVLAMMHVLIWVIALLGVFKPF